MFDKNKIVKVKWNSNNKEWFELKGYTFTKMHESFDVFLKDLMPSSKQRVIAICDYCGREYETSYATLVGGRKTIQKDCCPNCTGKKASEISKSKRAVKYINLVQKICKENGYILLTNIDEYINTKMYIEFLCPKHGKQKMIIDNFIRGHKCIQCSYVERGEKLKYDKQYVKEYIESINGNKLLNPDDYKDTNTRNLNILCSCGNIFTTSFSNYKRYNVTTCYSCSCKESDGEKRIKNFLKLKGIDFEQEKRFVDCRDIKPLPFDFYLPSYNLIIEFDGQHHFYEIGFKNCEITKIHDDIKNKYCNMNNIDILRIPYWEGKNIESIISKKLNL